jgi:hypothetical protein
VTVRDTRVWGKGLPQPVIKISKLHSSPEHTWGVGEIRMHCLVDLQKINQRVLGTKGVSKA